MRQFLAEEDVDSRGCLAVEKDRFHYLRNVLRVSCGDMISVRLPNGTLQQMTVALVDQKKKKIMLQIAGGRAEKRNNIAKGGDSAAGTETLAVQAAGSFHAAAVVERPSVELWLLQFVAKPAKMEIIVRQAVECGVSVIVPVAGTFCQSGAVVSAREAAQHNGKGGRWERIITEAREQSGSAVETRVEACVSVAEACALWQRQVSGRTLACEHSLAVVLYEQMAGTKLMHEAAKDAPSVKTAAIAVGAEGGIAPEEIALLQNGGFIPVHFATNILRCETAALYGVASLQTTLLENSVWQNKE